MARFKVKIQDQEDYDRTRLALDDIKLELRKGYRSERSAYKSLLIMRYSPKRAAELLSEWMTDISGFTVYLSVGWLEKE